MPAAVTTASRYRGAMAVRKPRNQPSVLQPFTELPLVLLELVFASITSIKDVQALRQTCKLFLETLDSRLTCIKLCIVDEKDKQRIEKLLKRVQHVHSIKELTLVACCNKVDSLFRYLPDHLSALTIYGKVGFDLKDLKRLPCLTAMTVCSGSTLAGLEAVSGLTSLHCHRPCGSVAHLASTLKHLSIRDYEHVQDIDQLTNLEAIQVGQNMPASFFHTHGKLPLKYLLLDGIHCSNFLNNSTAWLTAPTTLTHLILHDVDFIKPGVLPGSIIYLQLMYMRDVHIQQAVTALPGLESLELHMFVHPLDNWNWALRSLSRLTNLQSLGICMPLGQGVFWDREQNLSQLSEVLDVVDRGVELSVLANKTDLWGYHIWGVNQHLNMKKTAWANVDVVSTSPK